MSGTDQQPSWGQPGWRPPEAATPPPPPAAPPAAPPAQPTPQTGYGAQQPFGAEHAYAAQQPYGGQQNYFAQPGPDPYQPAYGHPGQPPRREPRTKTFSIIALVLGIAALLLQWTIPALAVAAGVAAVVLIIVARRKGEFGGLWIAGLVLSIMGLLAGLSMAFLMWFGGRLGEAISYGGRDDFFATANNEGVSSGQLVGSWAWDETGQPWFTFDADGTGRRPTGSFEWELVDGGNELRINPSGIGGVERWRIGITGDAMVLDSLQVNQGFRYTRTAVAVPVPAT